MTVRRKRVLVILVPLLALLALLAWVFASPIGASPDDDYHLASTWCASPGADQWCEVPPGAEPGERAIPEALARIACYAYDSEESAACQGEAFSWDLGRTVDTGRSNVGGGYPPVFYAVNGLLASGDVQTSALLMRVLSVALFLGFGAVLWLLLPPQRRPVLVWGWLISAVPLGLFLVASNNPSAWAITGVGTAWLALLGYVESTERHRTVALGAVFALAALVAAGARGDAALYVGLAILVVAVLTFENSRRWWRRAILPTIVALGAVAFFLTSRQSLSGLNGFGGGAPAGSGSGLDAVLSGPSLLAYNILNLPSLWAGMLTEGGLGWLDTPMPSIVAYAAVGVFLSVAFVGLSRMERRKGIALGLIGLVLVVLPLYVLQAGGDRVGQEVQPRYLLPLVVMFAGVLLLTPPGRSLGLTRLQAWLVAAALAGANFVALQVTMRRFITGIDGAGFSLDAGAEWWWRFPVGPDVVWVVGSLAFAGAVAAAVPLLTAPTVAAAVRTDGQRD